MYLVATEQVLDKDVESRIDEIASNNGGKGFFTEEDVFVATGITRVLVNSLPELSSMIEHFAFHYAKGFATSIEESMGASIYTDEAIDEQVNEDICMMTDGKRREMWMGIRKRVLDLRRKNGVKEDRPNLKYVQNSISKAVGYSFSEPDELIKKMVNAGTFARENFFSCSNLELTICDMVGEFIYNHSVSADHEHAMDLLREALSI